MCKRNPTGGRPDEGEVLWTACHGPPNSSVDGGVGSVVMALGGGPFGKSSGLDEAAWMGPCAPCDGISALQRRDRRTTVSLLTRGCRKKGPSTGPLTSDIQPPEL